MKPLDPMTLGNNKKVIVMTLPTIEGFIAAWVAQRYFKDKMEWIEFDSSTKLPDFTDRDILMIGISFNRQMLIDIQTVAHGLLVFDNDFKTREKVGGLRFVKVDMKRTPARMAWDWGLRSNFPRMLPWIIDYTESEKLWPWRALNQKLIRTAMGKYDRTFANVEKLALRDPLGLQEEGKALLQAAKEKPKHKKAGRKKDAAAKASSPVQ